MIFDNSDTTFYDFLNIYPSCVKHFSKNYRAICQFGTHVHRIFQFGTCAPGKVASLVPVRRGQLPVWSAKNQGFQYGYRF